MTQEDIESKQILKAELVTQREELDQMYYTCKNGAGKEFEVFLKIQAGNSTYLDDEYERLKTHCFFKEVIA